jgi:arginyl-tRNA synthetase
VDTALLVHDAEWALAKTLEGFGETVDRAAAALDPSLLANYLYDLARAFSSFYHDCQILGLPDKDRPLAQARLALAAATGRVLKQGMHLIVVPCVVTR